MFNKTKKDSFVYNFIILIIFLEFYGRTLSVMTGNRKIELIDDVLTLLIIFLLFLFVFIKRKIYKTILNKPLLLFISILFMSGLINQVRIDIIFMQLRSYLLMIGLYYIILWSKLSNKQILNIFKWIIILAIPIFISAIIEYSMKKTILITVTRYSTELIQGNIFRSYTLLGNPIDYSNFAILILSIILASIITNYQLFSFSKKTKIIIFTIMFLTLFMSNSRGPIIAFIFSILFLSLLFKFLTKKQFFFIISFIFIIVILMGDTIEERFMKLNVDNLSTTQYRILFLQKSIEVFFDNPIIGVGPGMYGGWVSINYHYSPIYDEYGFSTDRISSIDMFFPHLIGELGILGFIAYLLFLIKPFIYFKNLFEKATSNDIKFISLTVVFIIPMLFLIGWFSISLETQLVFSLYMIILGLSEKYIYNKNLER